MFTTENAEISDDFWKRRTRLYSSYYKRAFFIKALKYRRFGNDIVQSVSVIFHGSFRWFFTIKNHLRADDYATTVCAMKSTQLKQGRTTRRVFFNTRTVRRYLVNDLTCAARKTTFKTQKRFHNKQYTPKSKDQPFESDRTHFYVRFNNGNYANAPSDHNLFLSHKITTTQQKTTNRNNQSNQTIRKNNPRNHSIKNIQKTNLQNKHDKPSHQSIVKSITKTTTTNNPKSLNQKHAQNKT